MTEKIKVLFAYGPMGKKGRDYRWVADGEPVVIGSANFVGVKHHLGTTRVVVAEFEGSREELLALYAGRATAWHASPEVAAEFARKCVEKTASIIGTNPVGTVLKARTRGRYVYVEPISAPS